jgi:hypothetical protein
MRLGFHWKGPIVFFGKQTVKTEWQRGSVALENGERINGEIRLKLARGELEEFMLKRSGEEKESVDLDDVEVFGLHERIRWGYSMPVHTSSL